FGIEAYLERFYGARTSPKDANNAVPDFLAELPFFDVNRHRRLVDVGWFEVTSQLCDDLLVLAEREFLYLRCGLGVGSEKLDAVEPFDAGAAVPTRHEKTNRRAVVCS